MALLITNLLKIGAMRSKNQRLTHVFTLTVQYNNLPSSASSKDRIDLLHLIARLAGDYLTSKPPQKSYKNVLRWEGLKDLLEQIGSEAAKTGVRMLTGPTDYKSIGGHNRSYWLELLDPRHRAGYLLSPKFANWIVNPDAIRTKQSFWEYLGELGPSHGRGELSKDVAYLNETGGPARYQVVFDSGKSLVEKLGGQPYHTEQHRTDFSGDGWAIFVVSPTGEIYSASHIVGKLHHSSFLGGRPVMAAGELVVVDGEIRIVTAKSGHYIPSWEDLHRFVQQFTEIPGGALIRPNFKDEADFGQPVYYKVRDFRMSQLNASPVSKQAVLQSMPAWSKTVNAMKVVDKIPAAAPRAARRLDLRQ